LELEEEDDPFNDCDLEAKRTRLLLELSSSIFFIATPLCIFESLNFCFSRTATNLGLN